MEVIGVTEHSISLLTIASYTNAYLDTIHNAPNSHIHATPGQPWGVELYQSTCSPGRAVSTLMIVSSKVVPLHRYYTFPTLG